MITRHEFNHTTYGKFEILIQTNANNATIWAIKLNGDERDSGRVTDAEGGTNAALKQAFAAAEGFLCDIRNGLGFIEEGIAELRRGIG